MANILIIDDDLAFIKAAKRLFYNHEILHAADGMEGIDLLENHKVDLILLGTPTPKMNGLSVFEIITKAFADYPPTMMLAECGSAKLEERFLKMGGRGFLEKPVDDGEIAMKVEKVLEEGKLCSRSGQEVFKKETFRLIEAVDQVIRIFANRVSIQKSIEQDLEITTDRQRFSTVLTGLVENAASFAKDIVVIEAQEVSGNVVITIADNGRGINEEKVNDIFKLRGGTGLFLAYRIVTMLGGAIWFESKAGQGAIFYFSIPQKHNLH